MVNDEDPETQGWPGLTVRFYRTSVGNEPVREWIRAQPRELREAIGEDIRAVQDGWPVGMPLVRALGRGLFEVRTTLRGNEYRVMFSTFGDRTMVLLHAFHKKSRATPKGHLEIAHQRQKDLTS